MGKKKKSGKKGGKKKKGGNAEPEMSWSEALLAYKINIKERALEDTRYELRALEEKNARHVERNTRLRKEQDLYMKNLLKQAKDFEKKLSEEDVVEKGAVISVMMNKWEAEKQEENGVAALKEAIAKKQVEIVSEEKQVAYWQEYRDKGQHAHAKQIKLLQQELLDMNTSFDEMSGHLERSLVVAREEIGNSTQETLDKQKYLATEKAMAKMDKNNRQEVLDNDWLKKEVAIHKEEVEELLGIVDDMEGGNLNVMSELFECNVDDLKISRNFYLTQFADDENLDETGILEMDLAKVALDPKERQLAIKDAEEDEPVRRPKSETQKFVEDKVFGLTASYPPPPADGDSDEEEIYDGDHLAGDSDEEDPFNNYFQFDDDNFDDYLQLGPLELKLLSIRGQQIKLQPPSTPSQDEMKAIKYKTGNWP